MITYNKLRKNVVNELQDVRTRSYTVMGATVFTVFIFLAFAIRPVVVTLTSEIGLLNVIKSADSQLQTNLYQLNLAQTSYNENVNGNTSTLNTALPSTPSTGPLFANMNAIAQKDTIEIDTIQFYTSTQSLTSLNLSNITLNPPLGTNMVFFTASGVGTYTDFTNYVTDLENYPRTFNILSVNLSGSPASGTQNAAYGFTFTGYVYYL